MLELRPVVSYLLCLVGCHIDKLGQIYILFLEWTTRSLGEERDIKKVIFLGEHYLFYVSMGYEMWAYENVALYLAVGLYILQLRFYFSECDFTVNLTV